MFCWPCISVHFFQITNLTQLFFWYIFIPILYMLRAPLCSSSGESIIQGVSKKALQIWKLIEIYTEDIHNVLNCQNVAKHTEFYLGELFATVSTPFLDSFFAVPPPSPSTDLGNGCWGTRALLQGNLHIWKRTEDIHNVLNCQNVAKHTEFYLG
jgi:hypothetical protein